MKYFLVLSMAFLLAACNNQQDKETIKQLQGRIDSICLAQKSASNCEQLETEVDSLNTVIDNLKEKRSESKAESKKDKKKKKEAKETSTQHKVASGEAKEVKPVGKRASDGSIRCSYKKDGVQCNKRTFAKNGLCWQHGADANIK